ncbi:MAG: hypothetical protein P8K68_03345 [Algibacter sp.]|uniref:hypothetical protein n=1 Tax=Algibacter sp. TaxID=1872428 RepID=UPI002621F51E|nr:hypothetical protein [Algibacter sp.]MDG1730467.1 hypothetical protein [Algibacter sp.]MDG2177807.1 hypothetical protein [Algibacter sp.]
MKKIFFIILIMLPLLIFNSCEEESLSDNIFNYVTFADTNYSAGVDVGGNTTVDVVVLASKVSGSDRVFNVTIDPSSNAAAGSYDVPSSVTLPGGKQEGTFTITLSDVDLGIGVNNLVLNFEEKEGVFLGGSTNVAYTQNCTEIEVTLDIIFDNWGGETGYEVKDALGGVVASKPIGTWSNGQVSASEPITLCDGRDYTFTILDDFGDGLSDPADGSYTLTVKGVVKVSGGGNFGPSQSTEFDTK